MNQTHAKLELYTSDLPKAKYISQTNHAYEAQVPLSSQCPAMPMRIQFVVDVSASMSEELKLRSLKDGLKKVCLKLTEDEDEVGLIEFSSEVETIRYCYHYSFCV